MSDDDPIELREWPDDDHDDGPTAWERRQRVIRWVALIALIGMLVPGALSTVAVARTTAEQSCRLAVDAVASERTPSRVSFEVLSLEAVGWTCYAQTAGGDVLVALLGLIPGEPRLVPPTQLS
jgi:hypothetical protein